MKISQISQSNVIALKGKGTITKNMLKPRSKNLAEIKKQTAGVVPNEQAFSINEILRSHNITYCEGKNNQINVACGYNGGFYIIRANRDISKNKSKAYMASALYNHPDLLGGFENYQNLVKDVKRQDLIQKGLKIHTFELNCDTEYLKQVDAAANLTQYIGSKVRIEDLFFIEDEAFYYNKYLGKVYTVNLFSRGSKNIKPTFRTCEFVYDKNYNTIGYKIQDLDFYRVHNKEYKYVEQQAPSRKLKPVLDNDNNKLIAEGFRFGNAEATYREQNGIDKVLEFLENRLQIKYLIKRDEIQIVRFKDKNNKINTQLSYYDPTIGRSFVFDKDGKYLHQLEYNRDTAGEIIACVKI